MGASGCGKTTLSLYLQDKMDIPAICSYTTRPMRPGEVNGREHWFVGHDHKIPEKPLAYTFFGGHHYWTEESQVADTRFCTYVIDERGLVELREKWSDKYEIISVYIIRDNMDDISEERKERDKDRWPYDLDNFDIILHNNSDLNSFIKSAISTIASWIY